MPVLTAPHKPNADLQDEESALVLAAQKDPLVFQAVYDRWVVPVYQYIYYRTGDAPRAEDLTSILFLSAFQALPRYQHRGHFAAWLFTIARNCLRKEIRKNHDQMPIEKMENLPSPVDQMTERLQSEEIERLKDLILTLPAEDQELIRLRYAAGLSFADMALVLNKKEDAVKKSLYRLQARLHVLLEESHDRY